MCIFCVWICYIHVDWRISFICRGYEGIKSFCLSHTAKSSRRFPDLWLCYMPPCIFTGFPKREAERPLCCYFIRHQQHALCNAVLDIDHLSCWNYLLFHGRTAPRFRALHILRAVPLCKCHRGRELDDGHSQCCP